MDEAFEQNDLQRLRVRAGTLETPPESNHAAFARFDSQGQCRPAVRTIWTFNRLHDAQPSEPLYLLGGAA
jgi:hypothetical protein